MSDGGNVRRRLALHGRYAEARGGDGWRKGGFNEGLAVEVVLLVQLGFDLRVA